MKKRIFKLIFLGMVIIMSTSCENKEKKAAQEAAARAQKIAAGREEALKRFTPVQKTIAEKAVKMPAENNPAVLHKFNADPAVLVFDDTVYIVSVAERIRSNGQYAEEIDNILDTFGVKK